MPVGLVIAAPAGLPFLVAGSSAAPRPAPLSLVPPMADIVVGGKGGEGNAKVSYDDGHGEGMQG